MTDAATPLLPTVAFIGAGIMGRPMIANLRQYRRACQHAWGHRRLGRR